MGRVSSIILIALVVGCSSARKGDSTAELASKCQPYAEMAQSIMAARQSGAMLQDTMKAVSGVRDEHTDGLVISAYERIRMPTSEAQAHAVQDFQNEVLVACVKRLRTESGG